MCSMLNAGGNVLLVCCSRQQKADRQLVGRQETYGQQGKLSDIQLTECRQITDRQQIAEKHTASRQDMDRQQKVRQSTECRQTEDSRQQTVDNRQPYTADRQQAERQPKIVERELTDSR